VGDGDFASGGGESGHESIVPLIWFDRPYGTPSVFAPTQR
jgi:hypothetical protein